MNRGKTFTMKQIGKSIASTMVVFALLLTALATPVHTVVALSGFDSQFGFDTNLEFTQDYSNADSTESGEVYVESESNFFECALEASQNLVEIGESITLHWETTGLDDITINGESVSGNSGSMTIHDLRQRTVFTLEALSDNGSKCTEQVVVDCEEPPQEPKECELDLTKSVNKSTAVPGDTLTYTITIKNIGDADCTGGGVHIEDVVDPQLTYLSHTLTSNLTAGYGGTSVYTSSDRTLHFNGNTLTPGESGTITWKGKVLTPTSCGDFTVYNKARATAKELNNFQTWEYSNQVMTAIDNDCEIDCTPGSQYYNPEEDLSGYIFDGTKGKVANSSDYCSYDVGLASYEKFDEVIDNQKLFDSDLGVIGPKSDLYLEVAVPQCAYQIDLFYGELLTSLDGQRYGERKLDWDHLQSELGYCGEVSVPSCDLLTATPGTITAGNSLVLTWETSNATEARLNNGIGVVAADGSRTVWPIVSTTYVLTVLGDNNQQTSCEVPVIVTEKPVPVCTLTPISQTVVYGEAATLTWTTDNATAVTLSGFGDVALDGAVTTAALFADTSYTLTATGYGQTVECVATVEVPPAPVPSCDAFTASPSNIMVGSSATLTWETSNATEVFINNGIGAVAVDGNISVSPLADITYRLTVVGVNDQKVTCDVPVLVSEDPVPVCELFTATPSSLPYGGGAVALNWKVLDAVSAVITPTVGSVALIGSQSVNVTESTTYTLTATDSNGDEVSCVAPVAVGDPEPPFTCADNVSFTASDYSITEGDSTTLSWSTTDVDTVSISVINATSLSGSKSVSPDDDITYTLTATQGSKSISCPLTIDVSSGGGGGGGGSATPRCDLDISDKKISRGEEITLRWDTTNAREVTLIDDHGEILFTTDKYLASEKEDYYDGKLTLKPTRDTEYTLIAERGSRDRECRVEVEVEDSVVVLQSRDQQPLVAGIALSQVPYTGFEAGPVMTFLFYVLLAAWSFYITYLLVLRKRAGVTAADTASVVPEPVEPVRTAAEANMDRAMKARPDVFVQSVSAPAAPAVAVPTNLPTGVVVEPKRTAAPSVDALATDLENQAHAKQALLSSDAVRHFIGATKQVADRAKTLDQVISEAKERYPLEDGWIVLNEMRMRMLCTELIKSEAAAPAAPTTFTPTVVPEGAGSLAEAIVTGHVAAAYQMIGNRPMFALADAAADLDAVYRLRKGGSAPVSELLKRETAALSDEQIQNAIAALTGALDGTYTSEEEAVKMAIMKAVKAVA